MAIRLSRNVLIALAILIISIIILYAFMNGFFDRIIGGINARLFSQVGGVLKSP